MITFNLETLEEATSICINGVSEIELTINEVAKSVDEYLSEIKQTIAAEKQNLFCYSHEKDELEKEKAGYQKEVTELKGEIAEILRDTELNPIEKSKEILPLHKQIAGLNKEIGRVSTKIEKYKRVIELEKTYLNKLNKACRELGDIKLLLKRHGEYVINGSKTLAYDCQTIASAIEGFYSASEFSPESNESISIEPGILNKEYKQLVKMSNDISSFLKTTYTQFAIINKNQDNVFISIFDKFKDSIGTFKEDLEEFEAYGESLKEMYPFLVDYEKFFSKPALTIK